MPWPPQNAQGHQRIPTLASMKFGDCLGRQDRCGRSYRMTEGNASAVDVDLGRIEIQLPHDGTGLRRKGLVRLDPVQVSDLQTAALE
jgi:hypothetical protein